MSPIVFDIAGDALGKLIMVLLLVHLLMAVPVGLQLDRLAGGSRVLNLVLAIVVPVLGVVIVGVLALVQSIKRVGAELQMRPAGTGDPGRAAKDVAGKVMAGLGALPALAGGVLGLFLTWLKLPWDPEPLELGAADLGLRGALALAVFCALVGLVVTLSGSARWGNVLTLWASGLLLGPVLVLLVAVSVVKGNVERASELLRSVLENAQGAIDQVADQAAAGGASTGGGAGSGTAAGGSGIQLPDTEQLTAHLQGMSLGTGWWVVLILGALAYVWAFVVVFLLGSAAGATGARGGNSARGAGRGGRGGSGADAGAGANLGSAGTAYPGSAGSAYPGSGYPGTGSQPGGFPGAGSQPGGYPGGGSGGQPGGFPGGYPGSQPGGGFPGGPVAAPGGQWPSPPPQVGSGPNAPGSAGGQGYPGSGRPPGW
jgi:hypothetical protein